MADFKIGQKPENQTPDASWKAVIERTTEGDYVHTNLSSLLTSARAGAAVFMVKDRDLSTPPGSPVEGDTYIVKSTGTGDWAGNDGNVAYSRYTDDTRATLEWAFVTPAEPMIIYVEDENVISYYDGAAWVDLPTSGGANETRWTTIESSRYTATPPSTVRLTMSDTTGIQVSDAVRYTISSAVYYGQVTAVSTDTYIEVRGASLSGDVTTLEIGSPDVLRVFNFAVAGDYDTGTGARSAAITGYAAKFLGKKSYMIYFEATHGTADTGASQGKVNPLIAGSKVSSADANNGVQLSGTAGTYVGNGAVDINTSNYVLNDGDVIDIDLTVRGTNNDASNLAFSSVLITP